MAHILIADDDAAIRDVVRFALERAGFDTVEAATGRSTLPRFNETSPDLVVLDILMPDLDGLEVCCMIRRDHATPILFLSSRDVGAAGGSVDLLDGEVGARFRLSLPRRREMPAT